MQRKNIKSTDFTLWEIEFEISKNYDSDKFSFEEAKKDFLKPKLISITDKVKKTKSSKKPNLKVVKRKGGQIGDKLVQSFYD